MDMRINGLKAEWLIILILLVVIAFMRSCQPKCKVCEECVVLKDTTFVYGDTTRKKLTAAKHQPKPVKRIKAKSADYTTFVISPEINYCDTAIAADYFVSYIYSNKYFNNDSTIVVGIDDTLSQNLIQGRAVFIQNRKPTTIITPTLVKTAKKRIVINAGLMLGTNLRQFSIEPTVALQTKRDDIVLAGVDVLAQPVMFKAGYMVRISFRKGR